ncbi:MANSC domain-containing protein 1 [Melanerpes formicivorus]|uniref:MANSC domain-containing protein 1 n=1 Tax=Melanerpes formicivorus TaxID=211600 RepID=UPI00358DE593
MSPCRRQWTVCLVVITCVMARPSLSAECSAEKMENSIIDINLSLPRGVRGAEPLHAPSPATCVHACCSGEKLSGDKKCNLLIFDARRTSTQPNCYLFYCPSAEACPMKPATGLVSYKITRDTPVPEDPSFKSEYFSSDGHSLSSDAEAFIPHSHPGHQNPAAAVFPHESELQSHVSKQLDHSEFHTVLPESQRAKHPESLDPIPRQNLPPNMSSALFSTTQSRVSEPSSTASTPLPTSTTQLQSHTTSLPTGDAKPTALPTTTTRATFVPTGTTGAKPGLPATSITVTHVPLSSLTTSSTTKQVTINSRFATALSGQRTSAIPPETTGVSSNRTSHSSLLSASDFTLSSEDSLTSSPNNPGGYDPSESESYLLEHVLRGKGVIELGEEISLVAALLFGVIFLLLVIALTGKKVYESLQKRHYTRLDYLINGMYADV